MIRTGVNPFFSFGDKVHNTLVCIPLNTVFTRLSRGLPHFMDEPINGLDPMGIRQMRDLFLSLAKDGITVLISSHILSEIEHIADMVGILANGSIVQEVVISEIKKQYPDGLEDYFFQIMSGGAGA